MGIWEQPNTKPGEDTRWALKSRITYLSDTSQLPTTLAPGQLWTRTMRTGLELKINSLQVNSEPRPALTPVPCPIAPKHPGSRADGRSLEPHAGREPPRCRQRSHGRVPADGTPAVRPHCPRGFSRRSGIHRVCRALRGLEARRRWPLDEPVL